MSKMNFLFGMMAATLIVGCGGDPCEKAADRVTAKYEECGVDTSATGTGEAAECTEEAEALADCSATCIENADCSLLDGSATDLDALADFAGCVADCVPGATGTTTTTGS